MRDSDKLSPRLGITILSDNDKGRSTTTHAANEQKNIPIRIIDCPKYFCWSDTGTPKLIAHSKTAQAAEIAGITTRDNTKLRSNCELNRLHDNCLNVAMKMGIPDNTSNVPKTMVSMIATAVSQIWILA